MEKPKPLVPHHLGIILDGNRRWAKHNNLPSLEGHRRGVETIRVVARAAFDRGVVELSVFLFSTENWRRAEDEVGYLMDLFHHFLTKEFEEFAERNVRLRFAGQRSGLSPKLVKAIDELEARTADFSAGTLIICINYGGHQEIADAAADLVRSGVAADDITPALLTEHMYVPDVPPLDLIIRTSGEQRLSGFMLWRSDYAELAFVDQHWPAFTVSDLDLILEDYANRQRRFGH